MPRKGRLHIEGGYYHVIGRGLERRYIFEATEDKENFLSRLEDCLARCQAQCIAWALMSNHYHLLIRVNKQPLSKLMAPLLGGYAGHYNRRHRRSGYVFQNRFQSILCDADAYLIELVRYIHLNPVRAGMVENAFNLAHYRWTGHAGVLGNYRQSWHAVDHLLRFFGTEPVSARQRYQLFVSETKANEQSIFLSGGGLVRSAGGWEELSRLRKEHRCRIGDERILGNESFVRRTLRHDELKIDLRSEVQRSGWTLDKLIAQVCQFCSVDEQCLLQKARNVKSSNAKSLVCYWGTEVLGLTAKEIAARLMLTQSAVSYRVKVGREYCAAKDLNFEKLMS